MAAILHGWEAARVVRKHTMINIRAENVAEHTWGVVHILLAVWPSAPRNVILGAMYHDIGEYAGVDVPAHIRWENPEVSVVCDNLEKDGAKKCLPEHLHHCLDLEDWQKALIEICDRSEFVFSTYYERMMGNRHMNKPFFRSLGKVVDLYAEGRDKFQEIDPEICVGVEKLIGEVTDMSEKMGAGV